MVVTLPRPIYDAMLAHVRAGLPNEACGILAGDGVTPRAVAHIPARNAAEGDAATFSIIESQEMLKIWNEINAADQVLLAYYHSHPRTQAYPSPRDIQYANWWPGSYYLIFSLIDPDQPILRAFLVEGETVTEHAITIVDEAH